MKPEFIALYIDTITLIEGRIDDLAKLSERIKYHFQVDVSEAELELYFSEEVQDRIQQIKNLGINY